MGNIEEILRKVRERGERMTIQRRLVIQVLCQGDHVTISEVRQRLQAAGHTLDESTVYRILQWLKDLGIISQTDLGARGMVYELLDETPHHHLVCLNCGAVIGLDDSFTDDLRRRLRTEYSFEPRVDHLAIFGWCRHCQGQRRV